METHYFVKSTIAGKHDSSVVEIPFISHHFDRGLCSGQNVNNMLHYTMLASGYVPFATR